MVTIQLKTIFNMNSNADLWLKQLQEHGYRLTEARRTVVEIIASSPRALTPLEVYQIAKKHHPSLGLVSVYRTLEMLNELNLVQRVHQDNGCNAYLPGAEGHQHLLICERCGRAEYFQGDNLEGLFAQLAQQYGYHIHGHWLQIYGLCPQCRSADD